MKILLVAVNAKYIHSNPAVYSLRACAGENRKKIEIAEYTINQRTEEILRDLYLRKPDVLAFSCYIWNISQIRDILFDITKILPDVKIWLGGPEVSYHPDRIISELPMIQGIMVGEGERTFAQLAKYYCQSEGMEESFLLLQEIPGLYTKDWNSGYQELTDMSEIPFWYEEEEQGIPVMNDFENRILYYESTRGCPFRCSYCLSSIDKTVRFRPMEEVKRNLLFFLNRKIPLVKFIDRTFNCNPSRAAEIWSFLQENDNGVTCFHFEIAADLLTKEELDLLCSLRPGLVQLEIGVQTTNCETLKEINRVTDMNRLRENVERLRNARNMHIHLDLIAGLPYEDITSFIRSFNEVYAMKPDELQLGFLKVLSGSLMEEKAKDYGLLFETKPPYEVLSTAWLSYSDVLRLKRVEEMLEVFGNSCQFAHTVAFLLEYFESPYRFFESLAQYYEEKNFFLQSPARSYRYEVLYDFALDKTSASKEVARELLTYDMYLRENVKSRPVFFKDWKEQEAAVWSFYSKEACDFTHLPKYRSYTAKQLMRMTHLEIFSFDVTGNDFTKSKPTAVLFDYASREKWSGNVEVQTIEDGDFIDTEAESRSGFEPLR